jgi:hypothetical protein
MVIELNLEWENHRNKPWISISMFDYQRVLSKVKALKNLMVHDGSVILPIWHNGKVIYPKLGNLKKIYTGNLLHSY